MSDNDLAKKDADLAIESLNDTAKMVIQYSEDDRQKANELYKYYQGLIEGGDAKGETREGLSKALELREKSVENLIEIIKIKARLTERRMLLELKNISNNGDGNMRNAGFDNTDLINKIEDKTHE